MRSVLAQVRVEVEMLIGCAGGHQGLHHGVACFLFLYGGKRVSSSDDLTAPPSLTQPPLAMVVVVTSAASFVYNPYAEGPSIRNWRTLLSLSKRQGQPISYTSSFLLDDQRYRKHPESPE